MSAVIMPNFLEFYYHPIFNEIRMYYDSYPVRAIADRLLFKVNIENVKMANPFQVLNGSGHLFRISCKVDLGGLIEKIMESKYDYTLFLTLSEKYDDVLFLGKHDFFESI